MERCKSWAVLLTVGSIIGWCCHGSDSVLLTVGSSIDWCCHGIDSVLLTVGCIIGWFCHGIDAVLLTVGSSIDWCCHGIDSVFVYSVVTGTGMDWQYWQVLSRDRFSYVQYYHGYGLTVGTGEHYRYWMMLSQDRFSYCLQCCHGYGLTVGSIIQCCRSELIFFGFGSQIFFVWIRIRIHKFFFRIRILTGTYTNSLTPNFSKWGL
jgi:hypothetical protein